MAFQLISLTLQTVALCLEWDRTHGTSLGRSIQESMGKVKNWKAAEGSEWGQESFCGQAWEVEWREAVGRGGNFPSS